MRVIYIHGKCSLRDIARDMIRYVNKIHASSSCSPRLDNTLDNTFVVAQTQIQQLRFFRDCCVHQIRNDHHEVRELLDRIGVVPVFERVIFFFRVIGFIILDVLQLHFPNDCVAPMSECYEFRTL